MTNRVFVGNVDYGCNINDLEHFFDGYGKIVDLKLKKGFAFITFDTIDEAERVIKRLDGGRLLGRP